MEKQLKTRIQHKIDTYEHWSLATGFTPLKGEIIIYTTDENGNNKIGLKIGDGKNNVNDLDFISTSIETPGGGNVGGGNLNQIQVDYNQNDDSQIDHIKNRPFYSLPPEYSFTFEPYRTRESIVWDGVIQPNHPCITVPGMPVVYYKVSDEFITSQDFLNGYMKYCVISEDIIEAPEGTKEINMYLPASTEIMQQFTLFEDAEKFLNTFLVSFNIAGEIFIPQAGMTINVPEIGTYFLYDETGQILTEGYVGAAEGGIKTDITDPDLANDPTLLPAPDIYGPGTLLLAKKVSNDFLAEDELINSIVGIKMINWNIDDIDSSMSAQVLLTKELFSQGIEVMYGDDNVSYALFMQGTLPLFASLNSSLVTFDNNLQIPGPGTYLAYNDMGRANGGMELLVDKFETPEIVFQIDPKYIPKQKNFVPDYTEMDPESDKYIANRPYYDYSYYNYFNGDISDTSLKVLETTYNDQICFYQWGYDPNIKNPELFKKGDSDIVCENIYIANSNGGGTMPVENFYTQKDYDTKKAFWFYYDVSGGVRAVYAYLILEDNLTVDVQTPFGPSYTYTTTTFPKKGIYYLCQPYDNALIYTYQLNLRRKRNSLPSSSAINYVSSGSTSPITSGAIYTALGGRTSISIADYVSDGSSSLVTSNAVYDALQNVRVTTDSSVSSSSTNPIQSRAIYTALGNRYSLTFDSTPSSGSNNLITSGAVYTALGGSSIPTTSNVISNSSSLITSKGIYSALGNRTSLTFDDIPAANSNNLITSGGIYNALQNVAATDADTIDGYHFRVSETPPSEGEVDDYTITFVI